MTRRFDLIPPKALSGVARVFAQGVVEGHPEEGYKNENIKYLLNKLKSKLNDFEQMVDKDEDGLWNIDKVAAYAMMIHDVLQSTPQLDNRYGKMISTPRIALDVDDVVADFTRGFEEKTGLKLNPYWQSNYEIMSKLNELRDDKDFWVNLPVRHRPNFEPTMYISSRGIPEEYTKEFIQKNGLPCAPVVHVPWNTSKVDVLKDNNIDILCDDKCENFTDATKAGVFCYLVDTPANRYFDAKGRRIYDLNLFK